MQRLKKMKLFHKILTRRFGIYKEVSRSKDFKVVKKSLDDAPSVVKLVDAKIKSAGPISVADYMRLVLTNPLTGYYMRKDVFGQKGDFVTSPEISQMFGEVIGVWIYYELRKIGIPKPWQLIELGPGRGTLMSDILRVLKHFKAVDDVSVHLVEISSYLASIQAQVLCDDVINIGRPQEKQGTCYRSSKTTHGIPIHWYSKFEAVPKNFSVVIAHEFFDALPIHKYQKGPDGWREVLINSKTDDKGDVKFEYTLSHKETPLSKLLIREDEKRDHVEICPEAGTIAKRISDLLEEEGGFSLFIDYGHDGTKTDTFRAFKKHKLEDPLVDPGSCDLTADVDFSFLREVMKDKTLVFGPVEQGDFLLRMGIKARMNMLMTKLTDDEIKKKLRSGYDMIVEKSIMGERYKCMAAFPKVLKDHLDKFPVSGFYDSAS